MKLILLLSGILGKDAISRGGESDVLDLIDGMSRWLSDGSSGLFADLPVL